MENIEQKIQNVLTQLNTETQKYRALENDAVRAETLAEKAGLLRDRMFSEKNSAAAGIRAAAAGFSGKIYGTGFLPEIAELEKAYDRAAADLEEIRAALLMHAAEKHAAAAGVLGPIGALTVLYGQLKRAMEPGDRS